MGSMRRPWIWRLFAGVLLSIPACGSDAGTSTDVRLDDGLVASVNQEDFAASSASAVYSSTGVLTVVANSEATDWLNQIVFSISGIRNLGTYEIGLDSLGIGEYHQLVKGGAPGAWIADRTAGGGSVTIAELTNDHVVGTFSFSAGPDMASGATGRRTITSGRFDLTIHRAAP